MKPIACPVAEVGVKMRLWSIILSGLVAAGGSGAAHASLLVSGAVGGATVGVVTENFDTLIPGNIATTVLPSGITISYQPDAKPVSGSNSLYAAPFLSGGNGLGFGPSGSS